VIQGAFKAWSAVANVQFARVADDGVAMRGTTASGDIRVAAASFAGAGISGVGGIGYFPPYNVSPFNGFSNAGDIVFNTDLLAASLAPSFFNLAAHEIGHALGLDHTSMANSLMSPAACSGCLSFVGPQADDISGVRFLYGIALSPVPEPAMSAMLLMGLGAFLLRQRGVAKAA